MDKPSLKSQLAQFAKEKYPNWISGANFEAFAITCGKKASNGDRRCRELADEGTLEKRIHPGDKYIEYRYVHKEVLPAVTNRRCYSCAKDAVRFYAGRPACADHSPAQVGMF